MTSKKGACEEGGKRAVIGPKQLTKQFTLHPGMYNYRMILFIYAHIFTCDLNEMCTE